MIGYVTLGTNDREKSAKFYDILCGELGVGRMMETDQFIAWGKPDGGAGIGITAPFNGEPATVGNGVFVLTRTSSMRRSPKTDGRDPRSSSTARRQQSRTGRTSSSAGSHGRSTRAASSASCASGSAVNSMPGRGSSLGRGVQAAVPRTVTRTRMAPMLARMPFRQDYTRRSLGW